MVIRSVTTEDLKVIAHFDLSYSTQQVWQLEQHAEGDSIAISLRPLRLPRPLTATPPQAVGWLENWQSSDLFLVASEKGVPEGYLVLRVDSGHRCCWVENLAVAPHRRRQGIGTHLMEEAKRWARARRLRCLLAVTQTKNYPAICYLQHSDFVFCGFNERLYSSGDIALYFCYSL